jgi:hypothetical protein
MVFDGCFHLVLARKEPEGTITEMILAHSTGGLNIDASRISYPVGDDAYEKGIERAKKPRADIRGGNFHTDDWDEKRRMVASGMKPIGRWPGNVILSHTSFCRKAGTKKIKNPSGSVSGNEPSHTGDENTSCYGEYGRIGFDKYGDSEGNEIVEHWECEEACVVSKLDEQSGITKSTTRPPTGKALFAGDEQSRAISWNQNSVMDTTVRGHQDSGGASRFFKSFKEE